MRCPSYVSIQLCVSFTSFRLEIGDAVHYDMVKKQRLVVDLNLSGKQAAEVLNVPEERKIKVTLHLVSQLLFFSHSSSKTEKLLTFSATVGPQEALCLHRNASWRTCPGPGQRCIPTDSLSEYTCG